MLYKRRLSMAILAGLLATAGCGGGGGTSNTSGGGTTPPVTTPTTPTANATAVFHVDVATRKVTVTSLTNATSSATTKVGSHAIFTGSAIGFSSSQLLDQPGDLGSKVLSVAIINHWGVPIGQSTDGTPTGLKVRFSNFTNVSAFSDLRPKTTVSTLMGTGTASSVDGPIGSATINQPIGVAAAGNGVYYVADYGGQRIRKIAGGFVSTLAGNGSAGSANGAGTVASFNSPVGIAVNPVDGAIIVADLAGNKIRRITPDGQVSTVAGTGTAGSANGTGDVATFNQPRGLIVDSNGAIYVPELGAPDVRKIVLTGADPKSPSSYTVTKIAGTGTAGSADGTGAAAAFNGPMGIAIAPDGTLFVADTGNKRIRRIDVVGNVTTIAGTGVAGATDGAGNVATFGGPRGIAYANGALFVSDSSWNLIRQLTLKANGTASPNSAASWQVATLAGSGLTGVVNGTGDIAAFTVPQLMSVDPSGNIIVAESSNRLRKITPNSGAFPIGIATGTAPSELVQLSNADGTMPNPNAASNTPYIQYTGALAPGGTSNTKNWNFVIPNGVTAFEFTTTVEADTSILQSPGAVDNGPAPTAPNNVGSPDVEVRTLAGVNIADFLDGTVVNARFYNTQFTATDQVGNIFVSDSGNNAIRRISTTGIVSTVAGHFNSGAGLANGAGNVALFSSPSGIVVSPDGMTVYVADYGNFRVRRIALNSPTADPTISANWTVSIIAGSSSVVTYTVSAGTSAFLYGPYGLTQDLGGNLYVTEATGNRVRRIQFNGGDPTSSANWQVRLVAGDNGNSAGISGTTDGVTSAARFSQPRGIACDRDGNLYVSDTINHRIRKITPDYTVSTWAGGLSGDTPTAGYADGPAQSSGVAVARFNAPNGICVDTAGYVYVSDTSNNRIRRISPAGYVMTVAGTGTVSDTNGTGNVATIAAPQTLSIGATGTLYFGEQNLSGIRMVQRIISSGTQ